MDIDNGPISGDDLPEQGDKSPAVYKRHPLYYFEDANLFLKAQDSGFIYAVYKGMMAKFSETFEACFTFPQPQGKEEGTIFDNPILLPIDAAAFDVLCSFIFHLGWKSQSNRSTDELLALGRISQFLQCPDALKFAIAGLRFHSYDFNGGKKMFYASTFGVPKWGYSATREILTSVYGVGGCCSEYSIDMKIHKLLLEGESNLVCQIQLLAREIPNLDDDAVWSNCPQKDRCMKALIKGWEVLGPAIGQTRGVIRQVKVLVSMKVESEASFAPMRLKCREVLCTRVGQVVERIEAFVNNAAGERVKACIEQEHPEAYDVED
ncbi:hypothetical protein F5051DRAFT_445531 [Lentinula edodes]|nr:hypothetical protein F5051DRAFT_445531 [Lentinula edodes]